MRKDRITISPLKCLYLSARKNTESVAAVPKKAAEQDAAYKTILMLREMNKE